MPVPNRKLCHGAHYNMVAKRIRGGMPTYFEGDSEEWITTKMIMRATLTDMAMEFAKWFEVDNENFDPIRFMEACSNDPERYPLAEIWVSEHERAEQT